MCFAAAAYEARNINHHGGWNASFLSLTHVCSSVRYSTCSLCIYLAMDELTRICAFPVSVREPIGVGFLDPGENVNIAFAPSHILASSPPSPRPIASSDCPTSRVCVCRLFRFCLNLRQRAKVNDMECASRLSFGALLFLWRCIGPVFLAA